MFSKNALFKKYMFSKKGFQTKNVFLKHFYHVKEKMIFSKPHNKILSKKECDFPK